MLDITLTDDIVKSLGIIFKSPLVTHTVDFVATGVDSLLDKIGLDLDGLTVDVTGIPDLITDQFSTLIVTPILEGVVQPVLDAMEEYVVSPIIEGVGKEVTNWIVSSYRAVRNNAIEGFVSWYNSLVQVAKNGGGQLWV